MICLADLAGTFSRKSFYFVPKQQQIKNTTRQAYSYVQGKAVKYQDFSAYAAEVKYPVIDGVSLPTQFILTATDVVQPINLYTSTAPGPEKDTALNQPFFMAYVRVVETGYLMIRVRFTEENKSNAKHNIPIDRMSMYAEVRPKGRILYSLPTKTFAGEDYDLDIIGLYLIRAEAGDDFVATLNFEDSMDVPLGLTPSALIMYGITIDVEISIHALNMSFEEAKDLVLATKGDASEAVGSDASSSSFEIL